MLPSVTEILSLISQWPEIKGCRIIEYEKEDDILLYKIRCSLPGNHRLQIRLRLKEEGIEYSYQLFSIKPLLRWDNAPHHPGLTNFPHHFHDDRDMKHPSALSGEPLNDLLARSSQSST
ncbi:MAG: toxin-antitoxin system TumE family protein [Anaerolineae bacterium]